MRCTKFKKVIFIFLLFFSSFAMAKLTMQINASSIKLNDMLTLTLTSTSAQNQGQPNIGLLEKDFNIISTEHRVNYTFINGVAQSNNEWTYILFPKHTGTIQIPPLSIGKEMASNGVTVFVSGEQTQQQPTAAQTSSSNPQNTVIDSPDDVFIKTHTRSKTTYVNSQILYTVKVFNRRHLLDVEYTPPEAQNALVLPLEQSKHYQTTVGSNIYAVEELQYAIFPNKSGDLTIQPPKLKAIMYDLIPEHVHVKGQPIQVNVKPAPSNISSFLPALHLAISDQLDPQDTQLAQGATLTRIVTLKAVGVPASLLPTLNFSGKGFSTYPSPPELKNEQSGQGIIGNSTIRVTYLFNTPGTHTLPTIEIPWFNTQTQKPEVATLPGRNLTIIPDKLQANPVSIPQPKELKPVLGLSNPVTIWMISTLVLVLILACILIKRLLSKPKADTHPDHTPDAKVSSMRAIKQQLKQACMDHNAKDASQALLHWASIKWPSEQFLHLKQVSTYCHDPVLAREIEHLTEALYRQMEPHVWRGEGLWKAFEKMNHNRKESTHSKKQLPELNPR